MLFSSSLGLCVVLGKLEKPRSLCYHPLGFYGKVGCGFTATIFYQSLLEQEYAKNMQIQLVVDIYTIYR